MKGAAQRLLLLGGGHAHVHVLQALARAQLGEVETTLVTPYPRQIYSGMVPGWVAGHYAIEECAIALQPLAAAARVRFVDGAAVALDAASRSVRLADGSSMPYDLLSIDTGAVMARDRLPGARDHGVFVRPIEDFALRLESLTSAVAQGAAELVVIGGGAGGVELALALQHRFSMRRAALAPVRVTLVTGGSEPLAGYPSSVRRRIHRVLAGHGVVVVRTSCTALEAGAVVLGNGLRLPSDAVVIATGAEAPAWLVGSGLALDEHGFVLTGATLQSRSHADVFAVGDVATRADHPHPKSGVHAVRAGPPLAANLRRWLQGAELRSHVPQRRTLALISCGERSAIASWGGWSAEGRWVWRWKDRIDRAFVARFDGVTPSPARERGQG